MKTIKCLVVDDEPLALTLLEGYVRKTPFLSLEGKCADAFEAIEAMSRQEIDLIFLDIHMPELSGLQLSRTLSNTQKVIFTTAYEQYALEGFKVNALDYLLKPFNYEEFLKAASKARDWFNLVEHERSREDDNPAIFVKSEYKLIRIYLKDIVLIEGLKDYVKIHLQNQDKAVLSLMSLKSLDSQLSANKFLRIHRSFIVNLDYIEQIERNQVIIKKMRITVAAPYREAFQKFISSRSI
jgi:DNA-binding LytR/AlgR family response regulator